MNTTPFPYERMLQTLGALMVEIHSLLSLLTPGEHSTHEFDAEEQSTDASSDMTIDGEALRAGLQDMQELVYAALSTLRADMLDLAPPELEQANLDEVLSRMVEESAERLGSASRLSLSGVQEQEEISDTRLSLEARRLLYLVTREALYQVERRPNVRRIRFSLQYSQEHVQMSLEDDGIPDAAADAANPVLPSYAMLPDTDALSSSSPSARALLDTLRTRLEQAGGSLDITVSENGTRVRVQLPYATASLAVPSQEATDISTDTSQAATAVEPVSILIVDNQAVSRAGLYRLLESYPGLHIVGEAADGLQAVSEALELGPQVVLLDAQLPDGQSLDTLRQIKQLHLNAKVLMLATQEREEYVYETLRAGADGFILKDIAPDELVQAIRSVARGEVLIQPQIAGRLLSRYGRQGRGSARYETLTTRELEVLRLLARGLRNKEIASRLYVSERTVNFHLANIYQKLQVSGRTEALSKALERGLIVS